MHNEAQMAAELETSVKFIATCANIAYGAGILLTAYMLYKKHGQKLFGKR